MKNGEIIYGQGNFLFNRIDDEYRHSGLLIEVLFNKNSYSIQYYPVVRNAIGVTEASEIEGKEIIESFEKRSEDSKSIEYINKKYSEFASFKLNYYYDSILPDNILVSFAKKIFGYRIKTRSDINKANLLNILRCEAHRDLLIRAIVEESSFE